MKHPIVQKFLAGENNAGGTIRALEVEIERLQKRVMELEAAQQTPAPDSPYFCGECGTRANLPHHPRCSRSPVFAGNANR